MSLFSFWSDLKKALTYSKDVCEGKPANVYVDVKSRSFRKLVNNIRDTAAKLSREAEAAQEEKNRILAMMGSMNEGVIAIDDDGRILFLNPVLATFIGVSPVTAHGKFYWEVIRDLQVNQLLEKALREKAMLSSEDALFLTNHVFEMRVSPVFSNETFQGSVAVFYDITQIRKFEKHRSEFVANVSHELKTPLTSIMGFVETLKEGALDDKENARRFLTIIEDQATKLHTLIDDLLKLSRIEAQTTELHHQNQDLWPLAEKALAYFDKTIKSRGIRFRFEGLEKPLLVNVDTKSFIQVLANVLDNALKYNHDNGEIVFKAKRTAKEVVIEITDTGVGIPDEDLSRIFERFYRVDKSRSRETGGSGLGLSIAKHIIERHNGRIEARSTLSQGTTISIYLPS